MDLNNINTWTVGEFTVDNIRKVQAAGGMHQELIKNISIKIFNEAKRGKNILHLYVAIPPDVERYFLDKGFLIKHSNSLSVQKDNYYGIISW